RRRHTRSKRDWSSDVCSSDLHHIRPARNSIFIRSLLVSHIQDGRIVHSFQQAQAYYRRSNKARHPGSFLRNDLRRVARDGPILSLGTAELAQRIEDAIFHLPKSLKAELSMSFAFARMAFVTRLCYEYRSDAVFNGKKTVKFLIAFKM